jgi:hypothetical protein
MRYFGFGDLSEKLVRNGIHTLENVMTLNASFAFFFGVLEIWFEAIVSGLGSSHLVLKVCRMIRITCMLFERGGKEYFDHVGTTQSH